MREFERLYSRWLGLKPRQALRPKLPPVRPLDIEEARAGPEWPPEEPQWSRAEFVEAIARPKGVRFFNKLKCECENCQGSFQREWDVHNGMQCQLFLPHPPPPVRPPRPTVPRMPDSVGGSADWVAEVVVIHTSLTSFRLQYKASQRTLHFLHCKQVDFWVVDANEDTGKQRPDRGLLARWRHLHYLHRDPRKRKSKRDVCVPQVLIDGVPVGGFDELLMLEEENDLDYALAGEICPNCLVRRKEGPDVVAPSPDLNSDGTRVESAEEFNAKRSAARPSDWCYNCGAVFRKLINSEIVPAAAMKSVQLQCRRSSQQRDFTSGLREAREFLARARGNRQGSGAADTTAADDATAAATRKAKPLFIF